MKVTLLDSSSVPWQYLDALEDRHVFQTREWVNFVAETQNARPIYCELRDAGRIIGYFTGLVFQRLIRIVGSPFPGWTTPYLGFNMVADVPRSTVLKAVESFAFGNLKSLHVEICDLNFSSDDARMSGFHESNFFTYHTDLTRREEDLFAGMASQCRNKIRQAEKYGVRIEEAHDPHFAEEYYEQLIEVFAKRNLVPTYPIDRVRKLVAHLLPTGRLLLLRARDPSGKSIATGIYLGMNKLAYFWGNASFRSHQHLRPNEALHWHAMRYWKNRGATTFDWGGLGTYKEKYGVRKVSIPILSRSRFAFIQVLRHKAQRAIEWKRELMAKVRSTG
jgi:hypothetical protein